MADAAGTRTHAVRLAAGAGELTVGGLDEGELRVLTDAWSRCDTREVESAADLDRSENKDWESFHESLVYHATTKAIEAGRGTRLMFHAACLADPAAGTAAVLAAASGTGKTTATRRLGPHYAYITDETAIVDPDTLRLTPYAKPLSLLGPEGVRPKRQVGPDELGLGPTAEARLTRVAVLDRVREPAEEVTPRAEPMDLVDALEALVPQTSSLSHLPRGLVTLCTVLDRAGGAQRLVYAEAEGLREVLDRLLAEEPEPIDAVWEPLEEHELSASSPAEGAEGDGRIRRLGVADGVLTDAGAIVLLRDEELVVLEGLGPTLWLLLTEPLTVTQLLKRLAELGPLPPDAESQVKDAIELLAAHRLLEA